MKTMQSFFECDAWYHGSRGDWLVVYAYTRDSSILDMSNVQKIKQIFGIENREDEQNITIERASHWAVGWIDYIIINPENEEFVKLGEEIQEKLEAYSILDDDLYNDMQWQEYEKNLADIEKIWNLRYETPFSAIEEKYRDDITMRAMDGERDGYIDIDDIIDIMDMYSDKPE